jgi:hypothetical protein
MTSYTTDKQYVRSGEPVTFSCDNGAIRQTAISQDGFPATRGSSTYSWRLENDGTGSWKATIPSGGVGTFSVYVRRWDNSPDPSYVCEYSINNGSSYTAVQTINNAWLGSSDWKQVTGTINQANGAGSGDDIIIRIRRVTGERLMIDDFAMTDFAPTVTIANTGTPATGNVPAGTTDAPLFGFSLSPSGGSIDLTGLSLATAGTATSSDLSNFRVVYDADDSGTYNVGDSVVSGAGVALANPISFTISGQNGFSAARRYLVIADVALSATLGNTFAGSIAAAGDVTTTATEGGTATGNQQTIIAATCTSPTTTYSLTGGGSYCAAGVGVPVGLSGSESGVTYQLYRDASPTGQMASGTGSAISFGNQTVAGTYTVWSSSAGGYCVEQMTGSPSSVSVSVTALPTITQGANPAVCEGSTTASLTYSGTTGTPDQYSIDFDAAAEAQGFTDVTLATLPASPITIAVPGSAAAGTYTATLTVKNSGSGCVSGGQAVTITVNAFSLPGAVATLFTENMGTPGSTTVINSYSGWQNTAPITFSSTTANQSDVRTSSPSSGYTGASGSGNVFMGTATATYRDFIIGGLNTVGYTSLQLRFGLHRDNLSAGLTVETSTDGSTWNALTITQPPTASTWTLTTASGTIPSTPNLRIRFSKNNGTQFRIDDVQLSGAPYVPSTAAITPSGTVSLCDGGSVTLTASAGGSAYAWSSGPTTQAITVSPTSTTTYTVTITDANGCTSQASQTVVVGSGTTTWASGGSQTITVTSATGNPGWTQLTPCDLDITAVHNAGDSGKFTIALAGNPGDFVNTTSYQWPIAIAGNAVTGFNYNKFIIDTTGFTPTLAGSFSIALADKSVMLVYTPAPPPCADVTTPSSGLELDGETMVMTFVNESGLVSVQALRKENCTIVGREYTTTAALTNSGTALPGEVELDTRTLLTPGTKKVVLWATRAIAGPAAVNVIAIDECGRGVSFDPIITTVEVLSGTSVQQRFEGLLSAEHFLNVVNGSPGLERLEININGRVFAVNLTDGQRVASDLRSAMREGTDNVVILTGHGPVGSSAFVTLTDTATGNEQPLEEIVLLTLGHSAAGLTLTWPETLEGWQLQSSPSANAGWADVTTAPTAANGQWTLTLTTTTGAQFYRLTAPTGVARPATTGTGTSLTPTTQPSKTVYDALLW